MKVTKEKASNINIAYIGGGSREWAWKLMMDLALEESLSGTVKLYDISYEAACENQKIGNRFSQRDETKGKWSYETVKTLKEALAGTDFVIISILPGTFKEMSSDVHVPEKFGIYQAVGDTVGPGGLMRALRTIPIYVDFAEKIREYAPQAWIINYTNPMTLCTRVLYEVFPKIKAFGCCHEVFGTQKLLAAMLAEMEGINGVLREEIKVNVMGINHFTWLDRASYYGQDLFPLYAELVAKFYQDGFEEPARGQWTKTLFNSANRVKFDLFKRYGLIAAAGDRHLAEFCPPWYLKDPETVKSWKFHLTPVEFRLRRRDEQNEFRKKLVSANEMVPLEPSGEEGVRQIKALLGLADLVTNVNLPNTGQMPGILQGAVVETNALFTRDSIQPIVAGELPLDIRNLVTRHIFNQKTILEAALSKDRSLALRAFVNDPLVTIDLDSAEKLFNEMLINIKNYLPGWDL